MRIKIKKYVHSINKIVAKDSNLEYKSEGEIYRSINAELENSGNFYNNNLWLVIVGNKILYHQLTNLRQELQPQNNINKFTNLLAYINNKIYN